MSPLARKVLPMFSSAVATAAPAGAVAFPGSAGLDSAVVGEAEEGRSAIELSEELKPDIILMDIGMPVMDGIMATRQIKAEHPEIKVVMLTSHDARDEVMASMTAGADAYCMKGISIQSLSVAIDAVKDGASWLDPAVARMVLGRFQGVPA